MSIPRTASRLRNEHLFYNVEAVVYVEGGNDQNQPNKIAASHDIAYWQMIFAVFASGLRFRFKPIGGKANLLPIVEKIATFRIDAILVCMDRDHGHLSGSSGVPGVFLTYGYSWENDLLTARLIADLFYTYCPVDRTSVEVESIIVSSLEHFERSMRWIARADVLLSQCALTALPRHNFGCVRLDAGALPQINRTCTLAWVRKANKMRNAVRLKLPSLIKVRADRDIYGHLYRHFCFHLLHALSRDICGNSIRKDDFVGMAIRLRPEYIHEDLEITMHYKSQFEFWRSGSAT